jgi:hypothetical protein
MTKRGGLFCWKSLEEETDMRYTLFFVLAEERTHHGQDSRRF